MYAAVLLLVLAALVATRAAVTVQDKIAKRAVPFELTSVTLLDGPFKDAMLRDQKYLLDLDADRLLHNFRVTAGLPSTATPLGGWEAPDVELRGHTVGHYLSALSLMYASTRDARFKARAEPIVAELAKIQQAMPARGFHPGYLSAFPEEFIDRVETRQRVWAPYYTLHKLMAGLLDVYQLCGQQQALDVLVKMAGWVKFRMDRLNEAQQQAMLGTEFGGMAEVLANLYAVTGNPDHLRLARAFDHHALFDPLARREDPLNGLHGNTQIPKAIAAAREYELTGEPRYHDIASFFWERVAKHRSFVIGGNTDGESFFPIEEFSHHLGESSTETCNTYNMLKLTRHLFEWEPSADLMDFYERALYNHILASQDPATGMMCYYVPLKPGAFRTYSTPDQSFWCCVGTGMENHAKYGDTIYFHDDASLYVNLFIASELTWREKGLVVRQQTRFPDEGATRLTFTANRPVRLTLRIRQPKWAAGMTVAVNGKKQPLSSDAQSYVPLTREWKTGDAVDITLPMSLRVEAMPDDPTLLAVMYGPVVLAGDLGKDGLSEVKRYGPSAPQLGRIRTPAIPAFVTDAPARLTASIKPVAGTSLAFRTDGLGRPADVSLLPFYKAADLRYTVYWRVYSPAQWEARKNETAATESRRRQIEQQTIDAVIVDDAASEHAHGYKGEGATEGYLEGRKYREVRRAGWFSYDLKVVSGAPIKLVCTYRGSEGRRRAFDILVDGEKIASESLAYHPTETFDNEYVLPESVTRGKERVTVRFVPQENAATGGVFEVRVIRSDAKHN